MYIIGLNGSPDPKGNTARMLSEALQAAESDTVSSVSTELIQVQNTISQLETPFCVACSNPCDTSCYRGTKLEETYQKLRQADGLILGSPVYFGTVSGQLKAFWDMTRDLRGGPSLINVVGGAVSAGRAKYGGEETTIKTLHDMMLVQGMIIVGDGYGDDAGHQGAAGQRPTSEDEYGLKSAKLIGQRVKEVAEATKQVRRKET